MVRKLHFSCKFLRQPPTKSLWPKKNSESCACYTTTKRHTYCFDLISTLQKTAPVQLSKYIYFFFVHNFFYSKLLLLKTNCNETKLHMVKKNHDFDFLPIKLMACKKIGNFPGKLKAKFLEIRLGRYSFVFVPILCATVI